MYRVQFAILFLSLFPVTDAFSTVFSLTSSSRQATLVSSSLQASSISSEPKNSNSKQKNNAKKKKAKKGGGPSYEHSKRRPGPGRILSEDELSDHVSARYIVGSGESIDHTNLSRSAENNPEAQAEFLKQLNQRPALVLNADFQPLGYLPLSLWSWQDAVKGIFNGKVQVVDVYPDVTIRAANIEVPLPSVIALTDYVKHVNQRPAFTRRNVFLRDEYKCQYCGGRFHTADLSLDHVHPRSMGGQLSWENAVTCCLKCNGKKGSTPVSELSKIGMKLLSEPRCPSQMELAAKAARMVPRRVHPTWKPYLGIADTPKTSVSGARGDEEFIDDRYFEEEV